MDLSGYLKRIGFDQNVQADLGHLNKIQKSHLLQVPFENLNIHLGIPIHLGKNQLYQKIVEEKRGGFCYELNGLFYHLLKRLGYDVQMLAAAVGDDKKGYGPEFDHLTLLATIDGQEYISDVGFGEFSFHPLPFQFDKKIKDARGIFHFDTEGDYIRVLKEEDGQSKPQYRFKKIYRSIEEYEALLYIPSDIP